MTLPVSYKEFMQLSPDAIQKLVDELVTRPLNAETIDSWLRDCAHMGILFQESMARLDVAMSINTADETAKQAALQFRQTIFPIGMKMSAALDEKLFAHEDLLPSALDIPMQRKKLHGQLNSSDEAVAALNEDYRLMGEYESIRAKQSIEWQGEAYPIRRARHFYENPDRHVRETIWRMIHTRQMQDTDALQKIWVQMLEARQQLAEANGFSHYTEYRWREMGRDDYTPQDSLALQETILEEWSPLVAQIHRQQREILNVDSLRPWDRDYNPSMKKRLKPYADVPDFIVRTSRLFHRMHPAFGADFDRMVNAGFIDLAERDNTGSMGGFSRAIGRTGVFMFMNLHGTHIDAEIIMHEMGHAFAIIESTKLPYQMLWFFPTDFSETPSGVMEMLSMPYWDEYYTQEDLDQAYHTYIITMLQRSPHDVIADAFNHWVYDNLEDAKNAGKCAQKWLELHQQYYPEMDYTGIEAEFGNQWQSAMLNFYMPFFSMEYVFGRIAGLNLLGLVKEKPQAAIAQYRYAISLGNSVRTRDLFAALDTEFPIAKKDIQAALKVAQTYL